MTQALDAYRQRVTRALATLGIAPELFAARQLPLCPEAAPLVVAQLDTDGRAHRLTPDTAAAWAALQLAARQDGIEIFIVSAFRDLAQQIAIIEHKLARGLPLEQILTLSAPPGYSEHHSGRAIDIGTPGSTPTEEEFETTAAFAWLTEHAARFGFVLSFPRGNRYGYIYEPWHWYFHGK